MSTGHTEAPWEVQYVHETAHVMAAGGRRIAITDGSKYKEDAAMIAAAPELYKALEELMAHRKAKVSKDLPQANYDSWGKDADDKAEAALKKARST